MLMKDVHFSDVNNLLNHATKSNIDFECFEGKLIDNYIIFANHSIEINRNTFTYIIITEIPTSIWSSTYNVLLTNDNEIMYNYLDQFENKKVYQLN